MTGLDQAYVWAASTGRSLGLSMLAALLLLACLLASFSIGFAYLPAAVALAVAAVLSWILPDSSTRERVPALSTTAPGEHAK